ncbi:hypothetical protein [Haliscomenobacter sp.]|uniref:hypothetical protein n=1 Tax=Haliscomenobacter sp. TaxID=2717303 RepID=UPI0035946150
MILLAQVFQNQPNRKHSATAGTASSTFNSGQWQQYDLQSTAVLLNPGFETKPGAAFLGKTETGQSANYTQDYVMGIEYQNTVMQAIYNSEGRLYFAGSTTRYEYTMTDHTSATLSNHLGNARVSFTDQNADEVPEIIQKNHYYPFGLAMEDP